MLLIDERTQGMAAKQMAVCHPFMCRQMRVQLPARARCELVQHAAPLCTSRLPAATKSSLVGGGHPQCPHGGSSGGARRGTRRDGGERASRTRRWGSGGPVLALPRLVRMLSLRPRVTLLCSLSSGRRRDPLEVLDRVRHEIVPVLNLVQALKEVARLASVQGHRFSAGEVLTLH